MLLKINKTNIRHERRKLNISSYTITPAETFIDKLKSYDVTFNTNEPHNLKNGDKILYSYFDSKDVNKTLSLSIKNNTNSSFTVRINCFKEILIRDKIESVKDERSYYIINFEGDVTSYENNNSYHIISLTGKTIEVKYLDNNIFTTTCSDIMVGQTYFIKNMFGINNNNRLKDGYEIYEELTSLKISLPLYENVQNNLNDEDVSNLYFEEKKKELIPSIIDYEKRCFTPVYLSGDTSIFLSKIRFNLFFRDRGDKETRLSNGWVSDDTKGWNQCSINDNGATNPTTAYTRGDLLTYLNFNDDDVYYRKKKLSKSFLRLSFYNSTNPLNQMLLFYSTVFFDGGDVYEKYMNRIEEKINGTTDDTVYSLVDTICNNDYNNENNLTASFVINDKFNNHASSEGFYLYLFPDGLNEESGKTIYMKVEFNHAGYGRTLPFILPTDKSGNALYFKNANFPEHLINENGDLREYFRQLYIPVIVKYDSSLKEYVYHFQNDKLFFNNVKNDELEINLYEPKINSIKV